MKMKKVLGGLLVTGLLAAGVGAGTFAWFTADVKSEGNTFETGTFTLNGELNDAYGPMFEVGTMQPGEKTDDTFTLDVKNTGDFPMILKTRINLDTDKDVDLAAYKFTDVVFKYNGKQIAADNEISVGEFESLLGEWLPDANGLEQYALPSGHGFTVDYKILLDGDMAGNEYQGVKLTGDMVIEARQAVEGSQFDETTEMPE